MANIPTLKKTRIRTHKEKTSKQKQAIYLLSVFLLNSQCTSTGQAGVCIVAANTNFYVLLQQEIVLPCYVSNGFPNLMPSRYFSHQLPSAPVSMVWLTVVVDQNIWRAQGQGRLL